MTFGVRGKREHTNKQSNKIHCNVGRDLEVSEYWGFVSQKEVKKLTKFRTIRTTTALVRLKFFFLFSLVVSLCSQMSNRCRQRRNRTLSPADGKGRWLQNAKSTHRPASNNVCRTTHYTKTQRGRKGKKLQSDKCCCGVNCAKLGEFLYFLLWYIYREILILLIVNLTVIIWCLWWYVHSCLYIPYNRITF